MEIQKSFDGRGDSGILYLVPTPIGNLQDMTFRAINTMKEVDLIAAEDTRNTKKLCHYFEIETALTSYHEHNKEVSGAHIISKLKAGKNIALVSDAGMPCISDPGYELVRSALDEQIKVVPLPGANAGMTALIASGLKPHPFFFYGFLPRGKKDRKQELEKLKTQKGTIILYEAPHRLKDSIRAISDILGNRHITLCRELTKKYEEFWRGTVDEAVKWVELNEIRGEFCILIEEGFEESSNSVDEWWQDMTVKEHVHYYMNTDSMTSKEAIKKTASDRKMAKRDVYQAFHIDT